jgi:hypothetical protein
MSPTIAPRRRRAVLATLALLGSGAIAVTAIAANSLPSAPPSDAKAAKLTVISRNVKLNPTSTKGFNGYQTVTVKAPSGRTVLQGFATITGGNTGSSVIRSTQSTPTQYVVKIVFPGTNGTPGTLHVQVQTLPKS